MATGYWRSLTAATTATTNPGGRFCGC
uniref:Uncharacterized protein n=1 Tax=Rhizophora mucronata TaxID=61149 RepID=A0A2P2IL13_RHIMU